MEDKYIVDYDICKKQVTDMSFKQGNKNVSEIIFTICENGLPADITGETIEFRFLKPDGTLVYLDSTAGVTITNPTSGEVTCILTNDVLSCVGLVRCEIYRELNDQELYMPSFNFLVKSSLNGDAIFSTNYIAKIETQMVEWQKEIDDAIASIPTDEKIETVIETRTITIDLLEDKEQKQTISITHDTQCDLISEVRLSFDQACIDANVTASSTKKKLTLVTGAVELYELDIEIKATALTPTVGTGVITIVVKGYTVN